MASFLSSLASFIKPKEIEFIKAINPVFGSLNNGIIPLGLILRLRNPNPIEASLLAIEMNVHSMGLKLAGVQEAFDCVIPADASFEIAIESDIIASSLKEILKNEFLEILSEGSVKIALQISGNVRIKKFGFKINVPVKLMKEIEFFLDDILSKLKL